ncbi:hypothetical protein PG994_004746 [Apiospora phragmitis]|uniref:Uncharacterized protein n=1 Tax=Apiospora phragmitis TaxID=2905665 RepID=A0ABR1VRL4_9PEZI
MDATEKEHLLALVASITIEHGLDTDDMLSLADDISNGRRETSYPMSAFEDLIRFMSDIDEQIPEWIAMTKDVPFSDRQLDIVLLLIETRFWHGFLTKHISSFWHWKVVFGSAWPVHCQAVSEERITGFLPLMEKTTNKLVPWVDIISRHYGEDFGPGYEVLRRAYFPAGIEDVRVGFHKHYEETKSAWHHLEKRSRLMEKYVGTNSSLLEASRDLLRETAALLNPLLKIAKIWGKNTRAQKEWQQLPGNSCGLTYGWRTRVDISSNNYELCLPEDDGNCPWRSYCGHQTPIRMEKGSAWRDFLCNQRQPDLTTTRRYTVEDSTEEPDEQDGPLEIILPQAVYPIWCKHYDKYGVALLKVKKFRVVKDNSVSEMHSKEISLETGEDYWKTRVIKIRGTHAGYQIYDQKLLKGRPRFDAVHNLRLDYFNAALKDLLSKRHVKDSRSDQACAVLEGVDEI